MIVSMGEDKLLAASNDGYVSYSVDGGDSFTKIGKQVGTSGNCVSAIASGLADGDYIYAGLEVADKGIYRWQLGTSSDWKAIYDDTDTYKVYGIKLEGSVLYVQTCNGTDSQTFRTLNPTDAVAPAWSTATSTELFDATPQALKTSAGSAKLWSVATDIDKLYSYTDTVATAGPTLIGPEEAIGVKVNPIHGFAMDVVFSWEKPSDKITEYDLHIATDQSFTQKARKFTIADTASTVGAVAGHNNLDYPFDAMPGTTYFWHVRTKSPVLSPWSEMRRFTVEEAEVQPPVEVTVPPAPTVTVDVPPPVTVSVPPPQEIEVPPAIPSYMLWIIIGVGIVLVIALIILIVRTRRAV
jgi:hypothetical protein